MNQLRRSILLALGVFVLPSGRAQRVKLDVRLGCQTPEVVKCIEPYAFDTLDTAALEGIVEARQACLSQDKEVLYSQSTCLPLTMGVDAAVGRPVELDYRCADVCPSAGGVLVLYALKGGEEACCGVGGYPVKAGWGYEGCAIRASSPGKSEPRACWKYQWTRRLWGSIEELMMGVSHRFGEAGS